MESLLTRLGTVRAYKGLATEEAQAEMLEYLESIAAAPAATAAR